MWTPGVFPRALSARERKWKTESGKAEFFGPKMLEEDPDMPAQESGALRLTTLRSDSPFNTTIYSLSDRFRGIKDDRMVILMNECDMQVHQLNAGDRVTLETIANDGVERRVRGMTLVAYTASPKDASAVITRNAIRCCRSGITRRTVPGAKSIPVRIVAESIGV